MKQSFIIVHQMTLIPGAKLGPFEIIGALGSGGMGEVYRAHDARLGRDVAIKVLPERFSKDPDRMRRFEQEARAAGVLNHPNILAIYDVGTHEGSPYVVSELLEGGTLREVLESGSITFRRAIDHAAQIASGLSAAHDKGIIHRDLKPENVFITNDSRVKILDFGLAKLTETKPDHQSALPTVAGGTEPGVVMGTAGYMSPEQVRGQTVDQRSDIFSFGCILYEMLSGRRAFHGESGIETMNAILKEEPPDLIAGHPDIPLALDRIIRRCLEKLPDRRFRSASDLEFALHTVSALGGSGSLVVAAEKRHSFSTRFAFTVVTLLAVAALATVAGILAVRRPQVRSAPLWNGSLLVGGSTVPFGPRVSPDGRMVAFQIMVDGQTQVAVLQVNSGDWEMRTYERSEGTIFNVAWSSDGTKLFYDRLRGDRDRVFSVPAVGGPERLVLDDARIPESLADGSILINRLIDGRFQLHRFWPNTAKLEALPAFPLIRAPAAPVRSTPDGQQAVFYGYEPNPASTADSVAHLYRLDLTTKRVTRLAANFELGTAPTSVAFPLAVSPDGKEALVDIPSGDLHRVVAVPMDGRSSERTLLSLTATPHFIDAGSDGSIYVDQVDFRLEVVRTNVNGTVVERLARSTIAPTYCSEMLALADGRVLFPAQVAAQARLMAAAPGKEPKPFVGTTEETAPPLTRIGLNQIAFLLGHEGNAVIGIASESDGRLIRRMDVPGGSITCMATAADGKTIYYTRDRTLWALPAAGGESYKLADADSIAVNPATGDIVLQRNESNGSQFFRFDPVNQREQLIEIRSGDNTAASTFPILTSGAVAPDGRIVVPIAPRDSWAYKLGLLDPATGIIKRIPMNYDGGLINPAWTSDGHIVFAGVPVQSSIWRFRPVE
jgi:hypothetical protein